MVGENRFVDNISLVVTYFSSVARRMVARSVIRRIYLCVSLMDTSVGLLSEGNSFLPSCLFTSPVDRSEAIDVPSSEVSRAEIGDIPLDLDIDETPSEKNVRDGPD